MAKKSGAHSSRNFEMATGVMRFSRARMFHKRGMWKKKNLKVAKPKAAEESKFVVKKIGGDKNGGERKVLRQKESRLVGEVRLTGTRRVKRPAGPNARRFGPLRKTLSPGTVCILLAGRHKGKRVVYLKRMEKSGCMLVTGPHKLNNCPLRRIHQAYVIATKTKVDISGVQIPEHINDEYLKRAPRPKRNLGAAAEADIFAVKKREYVLSDQRKEDQKSVDKQVLAAVKEHKDAAMLKKYLKTGFGIKKSDAPHSMLF